MSEEKPDEPTKVDKVKETAKDEAKDKAKEEAQEEMEEKKAGIWNKIKRFFRR